jgi:hydrogenase maturation protein HypF
MSGEKRLEELPDARSIRIRGVVQGVGFRPFVYRLAQEHTLAGWVLNGEEGVEIHVEGPSMALDTFLVALNSQAPAAATISAVEVRAAQPIGSSDFTIRESHGHVRPSARISPDLPVCEACIQELFDPANRRYHYPYINCTNCGPRYSVIERLPYDRPNTTMKPWPLDAFCAAEYGDPANRRFHAQPVACPDCGPSYSLKVGPDVVVTNDASVRQAAQTLRSGGIVAVKGLGGYHLACDAKNAEAVSALRERKFRKEKPFAVMVKDLAAARNLVDLCFDAESLLTSSARPIVLAPAKAQFPGVAPDNNELGVMLAYTPLHHLLFAAGAPDVLVMTSANRSSEPIAYEDNDAIARLSEIADAFLIGERPIARRVDDSVARAGVFGPAVLRRSRGYAPSAAATLPVDRPILAVGADLKNTITLVVAGQAFVSQHIGDLDHYESALAFDKTVEDLMAMYEVCWDGVLLVHDAHPEYHSTVRARNLRAGEKHAIQHHRAHIASVLAEENAWETRVVGVSLDGTGYGDDGSIWGGEIFVGSVAGGFDRAAHLRPAVLAGGDAAAQHPVQAAAGFLAQLDDLPDVTAPPFHFPTRFARSMQLISKSVRTFTTTSMGRLFDAAAALLGFTREMSYEGQAAIWLEQLARGAQRNDAYPFPFAGRELDFRPLLSALIRDRQRGRDTSEIARAFQAGLACGICDAITTVAETAGIETVALSGGVFQNELLLEDVKRCLENSRLRILTNHAIPPNDGGISLGQAALAAFGQFASNFEASQNAHADASEKSGKSEKEMAASNR